jgi:hypothetical protein
MCCIAKVPLSMGNDNNTKALSKVEALATTEAQDGNVHIKRLEKAEPYSKREGILKLQKRRVREMS